MSYWFPKLVEIGVPTPKTMMINLDKVDTNIVDGLKEVFWMRDPSEKQRQALQKFRQILEMMGRGIGYPFFLRTGHSSHKHNWSTTCFITDQKKLMNQAQNLAEWSIMAMTKHDLPINVWAARRMIETAPAFKAFSGGMPITKEMRYFFKDHKMICSHPYWPEHALDGNVHDDKNWKLKLQAMNSLSDDDAALLRSQTEKVALRFEGYWSIDWLKGKDDQWYAIDMATGDDSFHFDGCPNKKEKKKK